MLVRRQAMFSSIHAYTNQQNLADVPALDLRNSRSAMENIAPTHSNAVELIEELIPALKNKIQGNSITVPVAHGSLIDLVTFTEKQVSAQLVNEVIRSASLSHYKKFVEYKNDPIVSSDVTHSLYSCIFDAPGTLCLDDHSIKTLSWFNTGWAYAHRVIDLIKYSVEQEEALS